MPELEEAGVRLVAETAQYDSAMRNVIADADKVDAALDNVVDAAGRAERQLNDIDGNVSVKANVDDAELRDARDIHDDINTNTDTTTNVTDSELTTAKGLHDDIDTNTDTTTNVDDSELSRALEIAKNLAKPITITIGVAGAGLGLITGAATAAGAGNIIEMDSALQGLEGTTGRLIPGAERLIVDLYTNAWGESQTAIANVIGEAAKLGIANEELEGAVRAAFNVSDTGIGETDEVLRTMDSMVKNNLAPDFQTAADIIVTGLQTGANRGDDLLDTFNEYGSTFDQLRISGPGALSLINSGLKAGIDNSDRIADAVRETGIRLGEIGTNPDIKAAFTQLDSLSDIDLAGSLEAFTSGEINGDEFFGNFFQALADAQIEDPQAAQQIAATLVGTIAEDFGTEAVSQLSPKWDTAMGTLEGRAQTASDTINDTLSTSITSFIRTVQQEFANILENVVPVDDIIDRAKEAIQTFSTELQNGATFTEAFAVALEIDPASLHKFESIIGNLGLAFADVMAAALDAFGQGDAADAIRGAVSDLAVGQFAFDIQLADNGEAIRDTIQTALDRGVDASVIADNISTAVQDKLAEGDIEGANTLINQIGDLANVPIVVKGIEFAPGTTKEDILNRLGFPNGNAEIEAEINTASAFQNIAANLDEGALQTAAAEVSDRLTEQLNTALDQGDFTTAQQIADLLDDPELQTAIDNTKQDFWSLSTDVDTSTTDIQDAMRELPGDVETMHEETATTIAGNIELWQGWDADLRAVFKNRQADISAYNAQLNTALATLGKIDEITGNDNPITTTNENRALGGDLPRGSTWVGEDGPEIVTSDGRGSVINAARSEELMQALGAIARIPANGGGSVVNNYINVSQANHVRNLAQANAAGFQLSAAVRGFA